MLKVDWWWPQPLLHDFTFSRGGFDCLPPAAAARRSSILNEILCIHSEMHLDLRGKTSVDREVSLSLIM